MCKHSIYSFLIISAAHVTRRIRASYAEENGPHRKWTPGHYRIWTRRVHIPVYIYILIAFWSFLLRMRHGEFVPATPKKMDPMENGPRVHVPFRIWIRRVHFPVYNMDHRRHPESIWPGSRIYRGPCSMSHDIWGSLLYMYYRIWTLYIENEPRVVLLI